MKETTQIQLPPPPRGDGRGRRAGRRSQAGLWVATALIFGVAAGLLAGWKFGPLVDGSSRDAGPDPNTPGGTVVVSGEMDVLLTGARKAIEEDKWIEARDLYQKTLNREPENAEAKAALAIIDRHLDGARGGLIVQTVPEGATVKVGEFTRATSPARLEEIPLGKYEVEISMDGFEPLTRSVTIAENEVAELTGISLTRSLGSLDVLSEPKGADYKILKKDENGEELKDLIQVGKTPAKVAELPPGEYKVMVALAGWPEHWENIKVEHNRKASVSAVFSHGTVIVKSDPSGAEVWMRPDGEEFKKVGETPYSSKDLPAGRYVYQMRYKDWNPITRTVEVAGGSEPEVIDISWPRSMVKFSSDPEGAVVYLYNKRVGDGRQVTPFEIELPAEDYNFTAVHPKFKDLVPIEMPVTVTGDAETPRLEPHFEFEYGSVSIESEPPGAGVKVNGKHIGVTPLMLPVVKPDAYTYLITKDQHRTSKLSGELEPGGFMEFNARLRYDPAPKETRDFANSFGDKMIWVGHLGGWVGETEVPQKTWRAVMAENPSQFTGDNLPVDSISWWDANRFCEKLTISERAQGTIPKGYSYQLPTDQQWSFYVGKQGLDQAVTSADGRRESPAPVGSLKPNEFGLYDVRGNVWEWCSDWYNAAIVKRARDGGASALDKWAGTERKVLRGGSWNRSSEADLDLHYRLGVRQSDADRYDAGLRVVLMPDR